MSKTPPNIKQDQFMFSTSVGTVTGKNDATAATMTYTTAKALIGIANLPREKRAGGSVSPRTRLIRMQAMLKA